MPPPPTRLGATFVIVDTQLSLLPPDSTDVLMNDADRALRRVRRLAPAMLACRRLFTRAELALLQLCLDTVEAQIDARPRYRSKVQRLKYEQLA